MASYVCLNNDSFGISKMTQNDYHWHMNFLKALLTKCPQHNSKENVLGDIPDNNHRVHT